MSPLPFDVLFTIFQYLQYEDLMTATEVCREWLKVATNSLLWKDFVIVKKDHCPELAINEILKIPRLEKTKKIEIWGQFEHETIHHKDFLKNRFLSNRHVEQILSTNLRQISFHHCILTAVDPSLFARFIW